MTAPKDNNRIPVMQGVLDSDGTTPTSIAIEPATHRVLIDEGPSGSDNGPVDAKRDGNYVSTMIATSSSDGVTPVALYVDSSNNLLVNDN